MAKNPLNYYAGLEKFSVLELVGLQNAPASVQTEVLANQENLIWLQFITTRLPSLLTTHQFEQIKHMLETGQNINQILEVITATVPNLPLLLAEFSIEAKVDFLENFYKDAIQDLNKLDGLQIPDDTGARFKERERYVLALGLLQQGQWADIVKLFDTHQNNITTIAATE